jgi:glycosyltransferase involved in cell wall biosynthesis
MKRKRVDILALKYNSFDRDSFIEDALSNSVNSMIFFWDFDKLSLEYKHKDINYSWKVIKFIKFKNVWLNRFVQPVRGLVNLVLFVLLFGFLCFKFRPKVCWIENTWSAVMTGAMSRLGICGYSIYLPGDWLASSQKQSPIKYLANNILFPVMDYLACRFNDVVLNVSQEIGDARLKLWGKKVARSEDVFMVMKINESSVRQIRNKICFLGKVRSDSGMELVISAMPEIWGKYGIKLKIIGQETVERKNLEKIIETYKVQDFVQISGFMEFNRLYESMEDCFCGINLITSTNSYSIYTIVGKLIHYIQSPMPVIVTKNVGPFHEQVRQNGLGLVIEPTKKELLDAVGQLYENQKLFYENILKFADNRLKPKINDYIKDVLS